MKRQNHWSVETAVQKGSGYVFWEMMRKYKSHFICVVKDSREPSVFRVQPHDPHAFWSFSKRSSVAVPWVLCTFSHGMSAFDPEHLPQSKSSHTYCSVTLLLLTHRSLCPALPTQPLAPARSQQAHDLFRAGCKQEISNILHRYSFCRVLCLCLALSFLPLKSKTFSREGSN